MKWISILVAIVSLLSCSNREVQLPALHYEGTGEIQNHSGIWIFFKASENDTLAEMNKNNKLQNTHWIFHIDKRLPMGEIAPLLNEMQEDHNKETMHKKEGMLNYLSFADSVNQRMTLFLFQKTLFEFTDLTEFAEAPHDSCLAQVEIRMDGLNLDGKKINAGNLQQSLTKMTSCTDSLGPRIRLFYKENLSYQAYLRAKADLASEGIIAGDKEWLIRQK